MKEIALLGFGTIGRGCYRILQEKEEHIEQIIGEKVVCRKALVNNIAKKREEAIECTDDFDEILKDRPDLIIELTGTVEEAREYITKALKEKIPVVTANKAVVSRYFEEFAALAEENDTSFQYEASVGGCIPIIKPLKDEIRLNEITEVEGILNGTCNYILTKMTEEEKSYRDVLKEAQELGFAEADPTADVSGADSLRKLRILLTIAFGTKVAEEDILLAGIDRIKKEDIDFIRERESAVKLIATGKKTASGYYAVVEPCVIHPNHLLYGIKDELNAVLIAGEYLDELVMTGYGAGMLPTADAVLRDVMDIFLGLDGTADFEGKALTNKNDSLSGRYYVRSKKGLLEGEETADLGDEEQYIYEGPRKNLEKVAEAGGFFARVVE